MARLLRQSLDEESIYALGGGAAGSVNLGSLEGDIAAADSISQVAGRAGPVGAAAQHQGPHTKDAQVPSSMEEERPKESNRVRR